MYRFRFSFFALCTAVAVCAITLGRIAALAIGPMDAVSHSDFLQGFYSVLLPMVLMCTLSVTVYAVPIALAFLFYRGFCDGYFVFSCVWTEDILRTLFSVCVHIFFTYGYLLLALRCISFRAATRNEANPFINRNSLLFFADFTSVAGTVCLCGLFSFTVLNYL